MCAARLEQIARLGLPEVMINESRLRVEGEEGLGTDVVEPGYSSLFDVVGSRVKLEQKSLAVIAQNLCAVLEAVHSTDGLFLGFLSAKTLYLSSDHEQFRIILNQEDVSEEDNDLDQFGRIVLGLCVLAFVDGEFDPAALSEALIVPFSIPRFWQDLIGRCTTTDAFVKPSFVWIRERIARFMAEMPPPNEKNIDPYLYEKALDICALQSLLMDIFEESIDDTVGDLLASPYVTDDQLVGSFVHYLIIAVFHRPAKVDLLVALINKLFARLDQAKVQLIKETILKMFPEKPASAGAWSNASAQMYFLYKGLVTGMFLPEEIVRMIGNLCTPRDSQLRRVVLHLFAYFADVVEEIDRELFDYIWNSLTDELLMQHISGVYWRFFERKDALREDNWKLLKQERSGEGDIRTVLANDRVDELRDLASHPSFKFDKRIQPSLYEPVFMESSKPTMIQYAAFYGSVECFRYLLMSGADLSLTDNQGETVVHHAVAGGNIEIVRSCEQSGCDFSGTLELAVRLYQNEIFDWLHATKFPDLNKVDRRLGSLALNAAKTNNIRMILSAMENDWDVSTPDEHDYTPLMLAALFGYTDVVQLLLCDPRVDINHSAQQGVTALKLAVEFGHVDTVRVLLSHPNCDLEMENSFGDGTPASWFANSIEVLQLLLEKMPNCHMVSNRNGVTYVHRVVAGRLRNLFDYLARLITPEQAQSLNALPGWEELFRNNPEDNWLNELTKS